MTSGSENSGRVALVGAGPGDPGWITVRGLELLRRADVVVYDALANPALLAEAPPSAERIDAGKRAREHKLTQDQINALLVEKARQGALVVRLKGGDPYLFGRGAEEAAFVAAHGVEVEVVPGITSGLAAPLAVGIPVTHRELASTVTLVTGHEDPTKPATAIDYRALAGLVAAGGTACFYMGVGRLAAIAAQLQAHGLSAETPAAVVQWGATPRQRSVRASLATAADEVERAGLGAPAIIVVGRVAALREPGLDFYTRRPLFGQRVLITRTRQDASELRAKLTELGAEVLEAPTIELVPPSPQEWEMVEATLRDVQRFDWLVLTSAAGAAALAEGLERLRLDPRQLGGVKIATVGDATAAALRERLRLRPDLVPPRFTADALAAELTARRDTVGRRFLLLRADIARPALPRLLRDAGAEVVDLPVYHTRPARSLSGSVLSALRDRRIDWVTFTSSSTASNLVALLGEERSLLENVRIASIGPATSATLRELGLNVTVEAAESSIEGLATALRSPS